MYLHTKFKHYFCNTHETIYVYTYMKISSWKITHNMVFAFSEYSFWEIPVYLVICTIQLFMHDTMNVLCVTIYRNSQFINIDITTSGKWYAYNNSLWLVI